MNAKDLAEQFRAIAEHSTENLKLGFKSDQLLDLIQDQHKELGRLLHANRGILNLELSRLPEYFTQVCKRLVCDPKDIVPTTLFCDTKNWSGGRREVTSEPKRVTHLVGYSRWFAKLLNQYAESIDRPASDPGPFDYKKPFEFLRSKLENNAVNAGKIETNKQAATPKRRNGSRKRDRDSMTLTSDETEALKLHSKGVMPTEIDTRMIRKFALCFVYGSDEPKAWYVKHTRNLLARQRRQARKQTECES